MTSRRIPISSSSRDHRRSLSNPSTRDGHATGAAARGDATRDQTTPFRSSLDLVFSFSRAAGFFGENLPSGPSFVDDQRYRPPNYVETDDELEESDAVNDEDDFDDDQDEYDRGGAVDEVQDLEEGDDDDGDIDARGAATSEQLPRNAVRRVAAPPRAPILASPTRPIEAPPRPVSYDSLPPAQRDSRRPHRRQHLGYGTIERVASPPREPSGATSPKRLEPGFQPEQPRRRMSLSSSSIAGVPATTTARARRASTFSKEAWKAAIEEHRGESTWFQSLFNTVNVLVGVGLLAEPLAFAHGGWILGTILLLFCALVTNYTAKMLAALMRLDPTQHTYADVLIKAFGPRSRNWIYALFVVELGTFSVAAIELFSDSLNSLFPRVSSTVFKVASYFILVPTTFLPLRLLSLTSLLGILSSIVLLSVIIADGSLKREAPGSLWSPMPTSFGPNWKKLPICFGLMMSGFSGHAVVPSLYRDMKDPRHFGSMINVAYVIAFSVSMVFAILGYVMFGNQVSSEITKDLSKTPGYPVALTKVAVWMVAINPLVKYAVANKPLVTTFEHLIGLHPRPAAATVRDHGRERQQLLEDEQGKRVRRERQGQGEREPLLVGSAVSIDSSSAVSGDGRPPGSVGPPTTTQTRGGGKSSSSSSSSRIVGAAAVATTTTEELPRRPSMSSSSVVVVDDDQKKKKQRETVPDDNDDDDGRTTRWIRYWILRPVLSVVFVVVAVLIPDFDRVLSFLGSGSAFVICCIGPIGAYLILSTTTTTPPPPRRQTGGGCRDGGGGLNATMTTRVKRNENARREEEEEDDERTIGLGRGQEGGRRVSQDDTNKEPTTTTTGGGGGERDVATEISIVEEISRELLSSAAAAVVDDDDAHATSKNGQRKSRRGGGRGLEESSLSLSSSSGQQQRVTRAQQVWLDSAIESVSHGHVLVISKSERLVCWFLLFVSIAMASVGTVWSFLP